MPSFLQQHYNRFRDGGGDHTAYVVWNEIDDDKKLCEGLREGYKLHCEERGVVLEAGDPMCTEDMDAGTAFLQTFAGQRKN